MDNSNTKIMDLKQKWQSLTDAPMPDDRQFQLWSHLFAEDAVTYGIVQLAAKFRRVAGEMDSDYIVRYASSIMSRVTREQCAKQQEAVTI